MNHFTTRLFLDITNFIFIEQAPCQADIILVPGGSHASIMEKACELFLAGYADYILPSGGYNANLPNYSTEFNFFQEIAINQGIRNDQILQENQATHTLENALFSQSVIQKQGIQVKKAILVCKNYHARRALMTYQYVFGRDVNFIVIPATDNRLINRDNWLIQPSNRNLVLNELAKIGKYFQEFNYDH